MSDLYNRIENLCESRKITITEMCRASGAPRGSLTDLKMGRSSGLNSQTLSKIAAFFSVSVDYLLGSEQKKEPTVTDGLSDTHVELIELARTLSEEDAAVLLAALKAKRK